jgi:tRNA pseudouridine55 synthase
MTAQSFLAGQILLLDKPLNWSSFQAVNKLKYLLKRYSPELKKIKIGHAGTLDPLATGLLIICTGKFTKRITEFQNLPKTYTGQICLGATTPSFDLETAINETFPMDHLSEALILEKVQDFVGDISQKPPIFSAIKKDGIRLYEHARNDEAVEIVARPVHVYHFKITAIHLPYLDFEIKCSKGTYIRSLANDLGQALNCGGHLTALKRTKIGDFEVINADTIETFEARLKE